MKTFAQFIDESIVNALLKGTVRQTLKRQGLRTAVRSSTKTATKAAAPKVMKVQTPTQNITGFRTGGKNRGANFDPMKGSKYQFTPGTATTPPKSTPFTAPGHHTTPAGRKPTTDMTAFTSKKNATMLRQQRIDNRDWTTGERLKGKDDWKSYTNPETGKRERIGVQARPERGLTPVEVWDNYPKGVEYKHGVFSKGGERMTHAGSPIVDIQTRPGGPGTLPLYGAERKDLAKAVKAEIKRRRAAAPSKPPATPSKPPKYEYGQEGRVTAKDVDVFQTRQRTGGYGDKGADRGGKPGVGQTKTVATLTQGPYKGATPIQPESKRILKQYAKGTGVGQNPLRGEPGSGAELTSGMKRIKKKITKRIEKKYPNIGASAISPSPRTPAAKDALRDIAAHEADVDARKKKGFEDLAKRIQSVKDDTGTVSAGAPPNRTGGKPTSSSSPNGKKKKKKGSFVGDLATFAGGSAVGAYAGSQEEDEEK